MISGKPVAIHEADRSSKANYDCCQQTSTTTTTAAKAMIAFLGQIFMHLCRLWSQRLLNVGTHGRACGHHN